MAFRNISEFRRRANRTALNVGLGLSLIAVTNLVGANPVLAQLRTGRSTDREFYTPDEPTVRAPQRSTGKRTNSSVVHASAMEAVSAEEAPTPRQVKSRPATFNKASSEKATSRVVQASCNNCQAGIAHSHAPVASHPSQVIVDNQDFSEPSGLSEVIHDPNAMVLGSTCQPCVTGCESGLLIQQPRALGNILRRMQFRIEAATFWPDGQNLPALVTTTRPPGPPSTNGLPPNATNLFGGSEVLSESTQGIRGEIGTYFDDRKSHGVLFRFFDIGSNSLSYISTPTSEPVVTRPFFNSDPAENGLRTISVNEPTSTSGSLNASISSDMYGGDILFRQLILRDCAGRIEFLAGYQTARLADSLLINSTITALTTTPAPAGTISQLSDNFRTTNRFNGMALGFNGILRERWWSLSGLVKLGFGNMERSVDIDGSSTITVPGNPGSTSTSANGLLARNTNAGSYVQSTFIVSPETNLTLGYRLNRRLEATIGYSYLGLPKVARVADQLDPQLASNLSNPPTGASTPSFSLLSSNYALHSLNYGLQWRY